MTIYRYIAGALLLFIPPIHAYSIESTESTESTKKTEQTKSLQHEPIKSSQEPSQTITNAQLSQINLSGQKETLTYQVKLIEQNELSPSSLRLSFSIKKGKKEIITFNVFDEMCDGFYEGTVIHDVTRKRVNFQYFKNPIPWGKEFTLKLETNTKAKEGYRHSFTINDETRTFTTYKRTKFLTMKALEGTAIITPIQKN